MCERDHDKVVAEPAHDHVIRKPFKHETLCASLSGGARHHRKGDYLLFQKIERSVYRTFELCSKSRALKLIPRGCLSLWVANSQYEAIGL